MKIILFFLCFFPLISTAQNFIGKKRARVIKLLQQEIKKNDSLTISLTTTDSTVICSVKAGKSSPADFIYSFNKSGKCTAEKIMASCDSCFTKYLQQLLANKRFEWKKINENQYISKYTAYRVIELPGDTKEFSYTILKTDWNRETYKLLSGQ